MKTCNVTPFDILVVSVRTRVAFACEGFVIGQAIDSISGWIGDWLGDWSPSTGRRFVKIR